MGEIRLAGYEDDDGVQVSGGVGWLDADSTIAAMLSPEQRILAAREAHREERAAQAEADERRERAEERAYVLEREGRGRSHLQVLTDAATAIDRQQRKHDREERARLQAEDKPIPEHLQLNKFTVERKQAERRAEEERVPASQADLGRLSQAITKLKAQIHALGGKP